MNKQIRKFLGLHYNNRYPIKIVPGNNAPALEGEGFHWETKGGKPIYYHGAYSKKGWSNMVYVNSTMQIVVGENWT